MNIKDEISNLIYKKLSYIYCDNCENATAEKEYCIEHFGYYPCEDCYRKYMNWEISKEYSEKLSNEIIKLIEQKYRLAIKKSILHYLCDDWNNHKRGKAHKENQAIFDKDDGFAIWHGIDLEMVMEKIINGIWSVNLKDI